MKSAYERALERMAERGIEPPDSGAVDDATRREIAAIRQAADAKLAEIEILHRARLAKTQDEEERRRAEEEYAIDRRRIEEPRDSRIEKLRQS